MNQPTPKPYLPNLIHDIPASVVVFLIALPLCLGVAFASEALPITGLISGIVGGVVVGAISKSPLSVSGPAAGLTTIVAAALVKLPSYEAFCVSVCLAGVFQLVLGYAKAGIVGYYIPNVVIKGMLAAIGLILILKQIPHFVGYDKDPLGEESFFQPDGENTFSEILLALNKLSPSAIVVALVSTFILLLYESKTLKQYTFFKYIPGPLLVVTMGIFMNEYLLPAAQMLSLREDHLVQLPVFQSAKDLVVALPRPAWELIVHPQLWTVAVTLAIVASLETLLSIEAIDKLDPLHRITPPNHELKAQGYGNLVSGFLGGLPVTSVIVRSSANLDAGARSKTSTIVHGILLMVSLLVFPELLNKIPKAALAAILIFTGYKLARISLFVHYYKKGWSQFLPFVITILSILFTDLLVGIAIGIGVGLIYVVMRNYKSAVFVHKENNQYLIRFRREVSFLNKATVATSLEAIKAGSYVLIDATKSDYIDQDVIEVVNDFVQGAAARNISVSFKKDHSDRPGFFIQPEYSDQD